MAGRTLATRFLAGALCMAAWTPYLPLTVQYLVYGAVGFCAVALGWQRSNWRATARHPLFVLALAWWTWLLFSATWSSADAAARVAHGWTYSLMLWVPWVGMAAAPEDGQRALRHFVVASCLVAVLWLVDATGFTAGWPWRPIADITGNQRIAMSLMLALACALALDLALRTVDRRPRLAWAAAALLCLSGLMHQDRRTGLVAAPVLALLVLVAHQRGWRRRVATTAGVLLAAALAWQLSPLVQQRFDEGLSEVRAYRSEGDVRTSWGMRLRMVEVTSRMALERPLAGHGLGSWAGEWRRRVTGSELLQGHTTPHNEYLLLAFQGGLVAWALLLALCGRAVLGAVRHHGHGVPALLVLVAFAWCGLTNVALRDAKFALPLLTMAGMAWAAARASSAPPSSKMPS